ncbi:MAG: hypothetical protein ACPLRA_00145, partial [Candidatus Saccharicenans sp.]
MEKIGVGKVDPSKRTAFIWPTKDTELPEKARNHWIKLNKVCQSFSEDRRFRKFLVNMIPKKNLNYLKTSWPFNKSVVLSRPLTRFFIISVVWLFLISLFLWAPVLVSGEIASKQPKLKQITLTINPKDGLVIKSLKLNDGREIISPSPLPFFSLLLSDKLFSATWIKPEGGREISVTFGSGKSANFSVSSAQEFLDFSLGDKVKARLTAKTSAYPGLCLSLRLENSGPEKVKAENLVPLAEGPDRVYITAGLPNKWPHHLSRTLLYRPGKQPIGVLLPDNAWHLGFCDLEVAPGLNLVALARRDRSEKAEIRRWAATLEPGGFLEYNLYFDVHQAEISLYSGIASDFLYPPEPWFSGLQMMFQQRYLYDLEKFDNSLYERKDLKWIRKAYLMLLQFAWDHSYYDRQSGRYTFYENLLAWDRLVGSIDIFSLWPTWPRLGLDQRN